MPTDVNIYIITAQRDTVTSSHFHCFPSASRAQKTLMGVFNGGHGPLPTGDIHYRDGRE